MRPKGLIRACALVFAALLVGCGEGEEPGFYYEVTLLGSTDTCNTPTVGYEETFTYRLAYDGNEVEVAVGPDVFGFGRTEGCNITYESAVWGETRGDYELRWKLTGAAELGGGGCSLDGKLDWIGTEEFEIIFSEDPDISAGCTYELDLEGKFLREVK